MAISRSPAKAGAQVRLSQLTPAFAGNDLMQMRTDMPPTVQLFVNGNAGSTSRQRTAALRRAFEAAGARVILSPSGPGAVTIAADADHVCVVGGDGTLRHVGAAVVRDGRPLPISVYPAGTVNLIARECIYPSDPVAFVARALHQPATRRHHMALIGEVPLFGTASVGPDSMAVDRVSPRLKRLIGRAAYVVAFLPLLARWPRPQLRVVANGREVRCEAVYIAKGRLFAGPWSFAPEAALEQPLLHIVALRCAGRRDFARFLWMLWRAHRLSNSPNILSFTCTAVLVDGAPDLPLQADGDVVAHLPARIDLHAEPLAFA